MVSFPTHRLLVLGFAAGVGTSCATYNDRTRDALQDFERGRFEEAREKYGEGKITHSAFLSGAEAGMCALAAGDWDGALRYLGAAAGAVEEVEREALVSVENAGQGLLSWVLNESASEYAGEGYERVLLHNGLGLAYLAKGDVEGLRVEMRRANQLLENEEELYDTEYAAGGLGHFLSAISYELTGEFEDAYIDYKRMEEKGIGGELVGRALVRLSNQLYRDDEAPLWVDRFGPGEPLPDGAASIIVIGGVGLGPFKRDSTLSVETRDGLFQWSVPAYLRRPQRVQALELDVGVGSPVRSVVVEDIGRVAKENLDDRLAWLATKSAIRGLMKRELSEHLQDEHGVAGRIAGDLFTFLTERADLRTWQTLPDTWQAARLFVPPGEHQVRLRAVGGEEHVLGAFSLEPGEVLFVLARTLGPRLYAYPVGGRRLDLQNFTETGAVTEEGALP